MTLEADLSQKQVNKKYVYIVDFLAVVIIALLAFNGAGRGLDATDSTYSLSNFKYIHNIDGMWFYSTFYANLLGRLFMFLPFGSTLLGMKFYSALVKCALALSAYFFFTKSVKLMQVTTLAGVVGALGLCWCPDTILYNYLSYFLFFLGAAFLCKGLREDKKGSLVIAGFFLGSNVFVRLPNVIEAGLIVVVWADSFYKKEKFVEALKKTGICIGGFMSALVPAALLISINGGISAYISGITEMFGMGSEAEGYGPVEMVIKIINSFWYVRVYIGISLAAMLVVGVIYMVSRKRFGYLGLVASLPVMGLLAIKLYRTGMFTRQYNTVSAFFGIGKIVLFILYLYLFFMLFRKDRGIFEKRLALMVIMICLITPLGTNNELYATLNNMFWALPVAGHFVITDIREKNVLSGAGYIFAGLMLILVVQSVLFGCTFSFRDGIDGPMKTKAYGNSIVNGVYTTQANADRIAGLSAYWADNRLSAGEVLLFGNVSGMGYILDTPVAISTAWPSLESFSYTKFEKDMLNLSENGKRPAVLVDNSTFSKIRSGELNSKQKNLKNFLDINGYTITYQDDKYTVLLAQK